MSTPDRPTLAPHEARDRVRLARADGVGPVTYRKLLGRFGTAAAAIDGLPSIARGAGRAVPSVPAAAQIDAELAALARLGGRMLVLGDAAYPPLLALLDDAPAAIAVLGDPDLLHRRAVAVVGGRNASANGRRMAERLAAELAGAGLPVVSGLARGVDTAAHLGALSAGRTVAAVAGGLDVPYPPENRQLQDRIVAEGGAVVAEAPLGTQPLSRHFPRRNRVIAGLVLGVVVVEAAPRSGSLITARIAHEAGRELFAVPGSPLDPRALGSNDLIRQGAHLTEAASDVLDNLPDHPLHQGLSRVPLFTRSSAALAPVPEPAPAPGGDDEPVLREVLDLLGAAPTPVDDLVRRCQFSASAVVAALLELELTGRVETLPGNRVALTASP